MFAKEPDEWMSEDPTRARKTNPDGTPRESSEDWAERKETLHSRIGNWSYAKHSSSRKGCTSDMAQEMLFHKRKRRVGDKEQCLC